MDLIYVGKIVNTHGIKGELRIKSKIEYKERVFKVGNVLYIGNSKEKEVIGSYRVHKDYDMVTFKGYDNINQVLKYLNKEVYIDREDIGLDEQEYLLDDLRGLEVYQDENRLGKVKEIVYNGSNILLSITGEKDFYIPNNANFIKQVDLKNKKVEVSNTEGLML